MKDTKRGDALWICKTKPSVQTLRVNPFWSKEKFNGSLRVSKKKVSLAVTVYGIWMEHNNRIFKDPQSTPSMALKNIISTIQCKL